ncbi:MAG: hypothetical protein Q8Q67_04180 [bacterium]|nr:hypothetical protein [bacterium]
MKKAAMKIKQIFKKAETPQTEPKDKQRKIGKPISVDKKMRYCPNCGQMHDRAIYTGCVSTLPIK